MDDDVRVLTKAVFIMVAVAAVCGIGFTTVNYLLLPHWRDMETRGTEHSYTFVQTKKELLLKLADDYYKLDVDKQRNKEDSAMVMAAEAQQKAIVSRMRIEASSLNTNEVPPTVLSIIR